MKLSPETRSALDRAYKAHHQDVFRTALQFAPGDRQWAKDCMHDVFLELAARISGLESTDDLGGWLYRVTVNTSLKRLRRGRTWDRVADVLARLVPTAPPSPNTQAQTKRDVHQLQAAVAKLPPLERSAIALLYFGDHSQNEAAELLGISKGYMSKVHRRALKLMQREEWELSNA